MLFLYIVTLTIVIYFFIDAFDYYVTPIQNRPHHDAYRDLRPAGLRSHTFAVAGSVMLLSLLLYSARKRISIFQKWGSLRKWLDIHIFFGVAGPLFIILHSTFKLNGLVAVSFWSMVVVALSGVIGRYLYVQIPRSRDGQALTLTEVKKAYDQILNRLSVQFGVDQIEMERINSLQHSAMVKYGSGIRQIILMSIRDIWNPVRNTRFKKRLRKELKMPKNHIKPLVKIINEKNLIERRLRFLDIIQSLFHYWHVFHKPFAFIMYIIMLIHIAISIWLGYVWIF